MTAQIPVPSSIDEVTAEWLTTALQRYSPGIEVSSADMLANMGGACTKLRIAVTTNLSDFPETVVVKGCLEPHSKPMAPWQFAEAMVYRSILPELQRIETIRCFFAQADEELGSILIMEDLDRREVTCRNAIDPITSYRLAGDFLDNLARIHARWWNDDALDNRHTFGFLSNSLAGHIPRHYEVLTNPSKFTREMRQPRATCLSRSILDAQMLLRAYDWVRELSAEMPVTLLHGDMHPSNLFTTRDGKGGLLDWTPMRGPWAHDVAYFIGGNLDPVDRRRWEKPLLQFYLDSLERAGVVPPDFDDAWFAYRIWMYWGLYVWLFNIPEYHSEEKITAMTSRYGTALVDHGTFDLIETSVSAGRRG